MTVVPQCTGECCWNITLRADGGLGAVLTWEEVAQRQRDGAAQMEEENHLERFLLPSTPGHFSCRMYDRATTRCTIYAERPETCRTFPKDTIQHGVRSNTCRFCGFTAD